MKDIEDQFTSFFKKFGDALNTYTVTCEIQHLAQILLITEEA